MKRAEKVRALLGLGLSDPGEFLDRVSNSLEYRWDRLVRTRPVLETISQEAALETLMRFHGGGVGVEALGDELSTVESGLDAGAAELSSELPIPPSFAADPAFARFIYAACRTLRPLAVIETGVALGASSTYILTALDRNGRGELESIDLPPLDRGASEHVGRLVPETLRGRWTLHLGSSRRHLPAILARRGAVDCFIHDSAHTCRTMSWEYRTVWPRLRPGGILISDDVELNDAFATFARSLDPAERRCWKVVGQESKSSCFGFVLKCSAPPGAGA